MYVLIADHLRSLIPFFYGYVQKEGKPVRLEDFAVLNGLNGLLDASSSLFRRFAAHERTVHDAKLDLWNYKVRLGEGPFSHFPYVGCTVLPRLRLSLFL